MTETVICVGGVVRRTDSILLVRQSTGHPLAGLWTIPWGRTDHGESPTAAVIREIREEAGVYARVDGLLGMQELPEPWLGMLGIVFLCGHEKGAPVPDMRETDAAEYVDARRLTEISASIEPLSAWMARRVLADEFSLIEANEAGPFVPSPTYL